MARRRFHTDTTRARWLYLSCKRDCRPLRSVGSARLRTGPRQAALRQQAARLADCSLAAQMRRTERRPSAAQTQRLNVSKFDSWHFSSSRRAGACSLPAISQNDAQNAQIVPILAIKRMAARIFKVYHFITRILVQSKTLPARQAVRAGYVPARRPAV